jgi:germination protein YpeB
METNAFLVRLGDYSQSLTKKIMHGQPILDEDRSQLEALHNACAGLSQRMRQKLENGEFSVALIDTDGYFSASLPNESEGTTGPAETGAGNTQGPEASAGGGQQNNNSSGTETEQSKDRAEGPKGAGENEQEGQQKYPVLIYDGPFAESVDKLQPKGLRGKDVSSDEAMQTALKIAGDAQLTYSGESQSTIAAYNFSGSYPDGRFVEVSVTKKGGDILWFMSAATGGAEGVPDKNTADGYKKSAAEFLKKNGFGDMQSAYAQFYSGICLINFAAVQNGVILYSDLVKVWVDRETSKIVGLDARNYRFSHTWRDLPQLKISKQEATDLLSENLEVKDVQLALIPITPQTEKLCWEFKGTFSGESYIVYINALTGDEEQIYRIIDSESGQLVI